MTTKHNPLHSFRETQHLLKKRLTQIFKNKLPTNWITLFIHDYPLYIGKNNYFSEIKRAGTNATGGVVPNESIITQLEYWTALNKVKKSKAK